MENCWELMENQLNSSGKFHKIYTIAESSEDPDEKNEEKGISNS